MVALREVLATLEVTASGRVAYITVNAGWPLALIADFINYPRTLDGVDVAVLFSLKTINMPVG